MVYRRRTLRGGKPNNSKTPGCLNHERMRTRALMILSFVFLAMTIVPAFLVFAQVMSMSQNKLLMFIGTVGWFVTAPFWMKK
jgi:hypothetical protein